MMTILVRTQVILDPAHPTATALSTPASQMYDLTYFGIDSNWNNFLKIFARKIRTGTKSQVKII